MIEDLRLNQDEQYGLVFHPGNLKNLTRPKKKNGNSMCLRFHSVGFCYNDCRVSQGHGTLDNEEAQAFKEFLRAARAARENFLQKRKVGSTMKNSTTDSKKPGESNHNP